MVGRMPILGSEPISGNGFLCIVLWEGGAANKRAKLLVEGNRGGILLAGACGPIEINVHGEIFVLTSRKPRHPEAMLGQGGAKRK